MCDMHDILSFYSFVFRNVPSLVNPDDTGLIGDLWLKTAAGQEAAWWWVRTKTSKVESYKTKSLSLKMSKRAHRAWATSGNIGYHVWPSTNDHYGVFTITYDRKIYDKGTHYIKEVKLLSTCIMSNIQQGATGWL